MELVKNEETVDAISCNGEEMDLSAVVYPEQNQDLRYLKPIIIATFAS